MIPPAIICYKGLCLVAIGDELNDYSGRGRRLLKGENSHIKFDRSFNFKLILFILNKLNFTYLKIMIKNILLFF